MKHEIYYNESLGNYTLQKNINGVESIKKKPLKFKPNDSTAKFRKELLKKKLLTS